MGFAILKLLASVADIASRLLVNHKAKAVAKIATQALNTLEKAEKEKQSLSNFKVAVEEFVEIRHAKADAKAEAKQVKLSNKLYKIEDL